MRLVKLLPVEQRKIAGVTRVNSVAGELPREFCDALVLVHADKVKSKARSLKSKVMTAPAPDSDAISPLPSLGANHFGVNQTLACEQTNLRRILDHMIVRNQITIVRDEKARAGAAF